ncbi:MAG: ABC transporter permease subunit [Vicinamibacterales bacterium]
MTPSAGPPQHATIGRAAPWDGRGRGGTAGLLAALFVAAPVAIGALYSLAAALGLLGAGATGFTLDAFGRVLSSGATWRGVAWTIATAGAGTVIAAAAACAVALRLHATRAGQTLAALPLAVPHVAAALAALLMFGQSGLLSRLSLAAGLTAGPSEFPPLVYDAAGVSLVLAFAWKEMPYLTLTAAAVLASEGAPLAEVARTLGASPRQAFWRVTWPRLWRGLAPAVLAAFAYLVGQYEMPALLAPSDPVPLSLLTYERSIDPMLARRAEAHVLALLALALSTAVVLLHAAWVARQHRVPA